MKSNNGQKKVLIKYVRSSDFKYLPVTGVVGGMTPNGEILGHLFIEHPQHPSEIELIFDDEGHKIQEEEKTPQHQFTREIVIGVILNPKTARSIGNWLINWADKAKSESL